MAMLNIDGSYYNTETILSVSPDMYNMHGDIKTYRIDFVNGNFMIVEAFKLCRWLREEEI